MNDLLDCVHAAVGTSCADEFNRMIRDEAQRQLEILLHRITVYLALPTAIGRSTVFHTHGISHWSDPGTDSLQLHTSQCGLLCPKNKVISIYPRSTLGAGNSRCSYRLAKQASYTAQKKACS